MRMGFFDFEKCVKIKEVKNAQVVKLVDTPGLGPGGRNPVGVRVPSWAPN